MIRPAITALLSVIAIALVMSFRTPSSFVVPVPGSGGIKVSYSGTVDGNTIGTPYGNVQVQVTLSNGTITDVAPIQLPNDMSRSVQIAQYATPQLRSEVLSAQSAQVNTISGATYTSEGYIASLQSALDKIGA